jgi:6-phosphogluconolactonase
MKILVGRRDFLMGALLVGGVMALPTAGFAAGRDELVYVGMHGGQIHAARFNAATGDIRMIGPVADNRRPTWGLRHPTLPVIYFNEEAGNDGTGQGGVQAFRVDPITGALAKTSDVRAGGGGTTHLWLDGPSQTLFAVNYGGGTMATIPVNVDGSLGEVTSLTRFEGAGPHKRQGSPHPHGVSVDPGGQWVLITDLGSDRIWILPFDRTAKKVGAFDKASPAHFVMPAGSGPRHMAWHPSGRFLYVVEELTANVDLFGFDGAIGKLTRLQSLSTDEPSFTGDKSAAEVVVSKDGRFVYTSNRGDHMIVVHAVDRKSGMLTRIQRIASGGPRPWHFAIHPNGKWMLVANRDANAVSILAINRRTGRLAATTKPLETPSPVHVLLSGL